jgi:D-alanyl-D-alanine carboxypeptidase/D-alanyl-D-alanine-endopeptidase (penicillin-binding protein 4)
MLRDMLRFSTNLTAEVIGLRASGAGSLAGSGRTMAEWAVARLGVRLRLGDHSGLGAASRVSALGLARALVAGIATPSGRLLPGLLRDVKMRDGAGEPLEASPIRVVAKSGTLNFASGLAGLIAPPGGREMVFAIFSADVARRAALGLEDREDPPGGADWTRRARRLQGRLIHRWGTLYG